MRHRNLAENWAEQEQARMALGMTTAGTLPLVQVLRGYLADMARQRRTDNHIANTRRILEGAVAAGVTDLKADDVRDRARRWLLTAKGKRGGGVVGAFNSRVKQTIQCVK